VDMSEVGDVVMSSLYAADGNDDVIDDVILTTAIDESATVVLATNDVVSVLIVSLYYIFVGVVALDFTKRFYVRFFSAVDVIVFNSSIGDYVTLRHTVCCPSYC